MTTPSEPGRPPGGPPLEPIRVVRPRRTDALAELFREFEQDVRGGRAPVPPPGSQDRTGGPPPVPAGRPPRTAPRRRGTRRALPALVVTAAALTGFGGALLLTDRGTGERGAPAPAATSPSTPAPRPPSGPGLLREGDSGPEVSELQERLRRIPDVYRAGATDGRYDATLSAAVARFQLWYGIRGDETGVYGDDTRLALESRTDDPANRPRTRPG